MFGIARTDRDNPKVRLDYGEVGAYLGVVQRSSEVERLRANPTMTEVTMNDHEIDRETIRYYVEEAKRMRAEALNEALFAWGAAMKQAMSALGKRVHSMAQRGKWNLSLPAPHH